LDPADADAAAASVNASSSSKDGAAMSTVDVLTARGAVVRIRPVTAADTDRLLALHERASERSRYLRFFSGAPSLPGEVERLVRPDDGKHLALLADDGGRAVGVASYEVTDADHAEFAVLVDDARQGEGVGTLLLEQLAAEARRHGIAELVGEVLPTNAKMLKVSRDLAPGTARSVDYEVPAASRVESGTKCCGRCWPAGLPARCTRSTRTRSGSRASRRTRPSRPFRSRSTWR
jgi:GNAT superfamily N-acetyltransferase